MKAITVHHIMTDNGNLKMVNGNKIAYHQYTSSPDDIHIGYAYERKTIKGEKVDLCYYYEYEYKGDYPTITWCECERESIDYFSNNINETNWSMRKRNHENASTIAAPEWLTSAIRFSNYVNND